MLRLYDTLSRSLVEFKPIKPDQVLFYHCGPTVYWVQHIGNLRGMTMGDLLVRSLGHFGYKVRHVRNYTDVGHLISDADSGEDKMEKGARREGTTPAQIADKYIRIFENDTRVLNLLEPTFKPRPTQLIAEIIAMVETLIRNGYAYTTDLAVYYNISKFPAYSSLARQQIEMKQKGAGKGEVDDPQKRHFADFALWIFKAGTHAGALQTWPSPFATPQVAHGVGFPGWHIECSVMAKIYLGDTIDIHMGGVEHIPVHHTNEIAQSEAANGVRFVRFWLHNEHLIVDRKKMAKSAGTGLTLEEVIGKGYDPMALRYFYLTAHYRTRQNFTWQALENAALSLTQLRQIIFGIKKASGGRIRSSISTEKLKKVDSYRFQFTAALAADLNITQALAVTWEVVKSNIPPQDKYDLIMDFDRVLGLNLDQDTAYSAIIDPEKLPDDIRQLIKSRESLRSQKRFSDADEIRRQLTTLGYILDDTPDGYIVRKR
ncbi:cysteine--tRNA ligase [Candidatus Gottesmanbacteria bacterium RBG_16_43_7]|uniref:Cysteine--tRNA ligase n=1 Tax=Candidatus Gottesmanbacteria bacterium RBG_16_43_7 TaxID=1798373 RepID=A0A1F5ZBR7_9BACT|nr:MAG: cysteine--tRNA ligase [Candidatus Gottesmanbacteria bacterium RBG_16_43_7]